MPIKFLTKTFVLLVLRFFADLFLDLVLKVVIRYRVLYCKQFFINVNVHLSVCDVKLSF